MSLACGTWIWLTVPLDEILRLNAWAGHLEVFCQGLPDRLREARVLRNPHAVDALQPVRLPAVALPALHPGGRGSAVGASYFLWLNFRQVHYLVTFASATHVQPDNANVVGAFAAHAAFQGPFEVTSDSE